MLTLLDEFVSAHLDVLIEEIATKYLFAILEIEHRNEHAKHTEA
jgi:hypothetical protein